MESFQIAPQKQATPAPATPTNTDANMDQTTLMIIVANTYDQWVLKSKILAEMKKEKRMAECRKENRGEMGMIHGRLQKIETTTLKKLRRATSGFGGASVTRSPVRRQQTIKQSNL